MTGRQVCAGSMLARSEKVCVFLIGKKSIKNQLKSDQDAPRGAPDANDELVFASRVGKAATRATKHEGYEACDKRKKRQEKRRPVGKWKKGK